MLKGITRELKNFIEDEYRKKIYKIQGERQRVSSQFTKDNQNKLLDEFKEKFAHVFKEIEKMAEYIDKQPKLELGYELEDMVEQLDDGTFEIDIDSVVDILFMYTPEQKAIILDFDKQIRDLNKEQEKLMVRLSLVQDFEIVQAILKEYDIEL